MKELLDGKQSQWWRWPMEWAPRMNIEGEGNQDGTINHFGFGVIVWQLPRSLNEQQQLNMGDPARWEKPSGLCSRHPLNQPTNHPTTSHHFQPSHERLRSLTVRTVSTYVAKNDWLYREKSRPKSFFKFDNCFLKLSSTRKLHPLISSLWAKESQVSPVGPSHVRPLVPFRSKPF